MEVTTDGQFRVLDNPRRVDELLLVERSGVDGTISESAESATPVDGDSFTPTAVRTDGYDGELAEAVDDLEPGYVIDATLAWDDGTARFVALTVVKRTRFSFFDGVTGVFEVARETWEAAEREGEAMNSRVTRSTDGDANGVVYVFAEQPGVRDLYEEFRNGTLPLEPLIARVNETRDEDHELFVMRPADEPFVLVYIVFEKGGLLARTVRETYGG